jgi:hypothetical protein
MEHLPFYRSSISIDKFLKPLPMTALEETESSASAVLRSKGMRRGDDCGDLGHAEERDHALQEEARKVEEGAAGLIRQGMAAEDAAANADVAAEAGPGQTEEATTEEITATEVIAPRTTTDETVAGEAIAAEVSSGPAGQEELREVAEEAMKEASAGAETLEPPEMAVQASSSTAPALGTKAGTPVPGMGIDKVADPPCVGTGADPEKVSKEILAARTGEGDRGEASVTPGASAKSTSGGKTFAASTGSGAGSQSSASQLQKEWVDTASSAGSGRTSRTRGGNLTLAKLSKQLATVKSSLGNVSLLFIEAEKTINVSDLFLASDSSAGCSTLPARQPTG